LTFGHECAFGHRCHRRHGSGSGHEADQRLGTERVGRPSRAEIDVDLLSPQTGCETLYFDVDVDKRIGGMIARGRRVDVDPRQRAEHFHRPAEVGA
jgi:hypothetical protein